jgi:F-type H+-transporting ATPase subunit b
MLRASTVGYCALLGGLLLAGSGCSKGHEEEGAKRYHLKGHSKEGHFEKEIDPKNEAHRKDVIDALEKEEAEELVEKRSVDLMKLRVDLGLWTVVVFILLFLILRKVAWGPMLEGLHKREESILGALSEAEKARAEAKMLHDKFQKEMEKIGDKSRELMDEARRNAQRLQEEMMAKAKTEIGAERERLHREIDMARDQALKEITEHTIQLATLVSAKAIKRDLGMDDHRRLVDDAVAELSKTVTAVRKQVWS